MNNEAHAFLEALFGSKPAKLYVLVWTLHDKSSRWFSNLDEAVVYVESAGARDVYVGVGLSPADFGPRNRCVSDEVAGIVGLWADFDLKSDAHKKALPATIEDALALIPPELPPSIVVITGNGLHAWWLFNEPWIFVNEVERKKAKALIERFSTLLRYNSSQRGWVFDRLSDLARVLRIPGTINGKDPNAPKEVKLHSSNERRYNPSDLEEYLDNREITDSDADDHAADEFTARLADKPLSINLDAAIPDDVLARWMETDARFRKTWNRQRNDLNDQSQSGYDLALACFGVDNRLGEQQIVELISHHRRLHREQPRTREDYFRRTISKAMKRADSQGMLVPGSTIPKGHEAIAAPVVDAPESDADRLRHKAILCDQLSKLLKVTILRLRKIGGKEPTYLMDLEHGCIEFPTFGKLTSHKFVSDKIAGEMGRLIPMFRTLQWRQIVELMLDACTDEDGTDDLKLDGLARIYLGDYLADNPFIASLEGQTASGLRRPMVEGGKIAISATDLQMFINKQTMQNLSVKAVASMVAAIGAKAVRIRGNTFKEQSRWALPPGEFSPDDYTVRDGEDGARGE